MGQVSSNDFKKRHFLHSFKFFDHRLYVFFPGSDHHFVFELFDSGQPYQLFIPESISLPNGSIYLIGGRSVREKSSKQKGKKNIMESMSQENRVSRPSFTIFTTDEVVKINLNKHKNMRIELSHSKTCPQLPEPRHGHVLVYSFPYIYVIGGKVEDITPTRTCLRYHIKNLTWSRISDLDLAAVSLANLSGLAIAPEKPDEASRFLYIFDSTAKKLPSVFQYDIELDSWSQLVISQKNKEVEVPASINISVYQVSAENLLILSGSHINGEQQQRGYSYIFNLQTEKIKNFKMEKHLDFMLNDKQGDRCYTNQERVFLNFGENYALCYNTSDEEFFSTKLLGEKAPKKSFFDNSCCSKRNS